MHYERLRRIERYYPSFLSFLRTNALRSQSVESIYDHRQCKGKTSRLFFRRRFNFFFFDQIFFDL